MEATRKGNLAGLKTGSSPGFRRGLKTGSNPGFRRVQIFSSLSASREAGVQKGLSESRNQSNTRVSDFLFLLRVAEECCSYPHTRTSGCPGKAPRHLSRRSGNVFFEFRVTYLEKERKGE